MYANPNIDVHDDDEGALIDVYMSLELFSISVFRLRCTTNHIFIIFENKLNYCNDLLKYY